MSDKSATGREVSYLVTEHGQHIYYGYDGCVFFLGADWEGKATKGTADTVKVHAYTKHRNGVGKYWHQNR